MRRPKGAVRCYRTVPATSEDAVADAMDHFRGLGWEPLEIDYSMHTFGQHDRWIEVALWVRVPKRERVVA